MHTRIRRLSILLPLLLVLAACGDEPSPTAPPMAEGPRAAPGPVVYGVAPYFELTDQRGATFREDALVGRVWVANFFFTRCKSICPVQRERLVAAQDSLKDNAQRADIQFVSISVDGDFDRPEVLSAYAEAAGADPDRWSFLTGEPREIWLLSTEGFHIPAGPDPAEANVPPGHSGMFAVVDRRGRIRNLIDSQQKDATEKLVGALEALVQEPAPARIFIPDDLNETGWLQKRAAAQQKASEGWSVRHDLRFRDRRFASGIRFKHRMVDDGGKFYKAVHYDHGNGVAVADVDGDGLYDLYFCNQVGGNQLWRNLGGGRFENRTDEAGLAVADAIGVTASFADTDNDGDPDLYVTTVRGGNHLFLNDGRGRFEDVPKAAGLTHRGHSSAAVFFDYDKDGLLDLLLCNVGKYTQDRKVPVIDDSTTAGQAAGACEYYLGFLDGFSGHLKPDRTERSLLYRTLGGTRFEEVSAKLGFDDGSWTGAATPIDVNEDGWLDLYVLNMEGHDQYWENVGGKAFKRRSAEVFPNTPWGSMGVKVFDFDADGDFDLFLTDMHSDMSHVVGPEAEKQKSRMTWPESFTQADGHDIWGNAFFRKEGPGRFVEVSYALGTETWWPWGISVEDLNADGYDDVFVASGMNYPFRYGANSVLLNDAGRGFLDSEFVLGVEPREGQLTRPWFDVNCMPGADGDHVACRGKAGPGVVWGARASRSSVIFDIDGDGDLDIVTNEFNTEPMVLISDLSERGDAHVLTIRLHGKRSNRDGLGAIVRVHVGGKVFSKAHDGQSGYLSQSSKPLVFGLGSSERADKVEVLWPSGTQQTIAAPTPVMGLLLIEEP